MSAAISRAQAWCKLAVLIADGGPAPRDILFYPADRGFSHDMLDVVVDDASALWWWADRFGAVLSDPTVMRDEIRWRQSAATSLDADWHGFYVTVKTYDASTLGAPVDGLAAVRALADADLTPGVGEVAGPGGRSGPATATEGRAPGGAGVA